MLKPLLWPLPFSLIQSFSSTNFKKRCILMQWPICNMQLLLHDFLRIRIKYFCKRKTEQINHTESLLRFSFDFVIFFFILKLAHRSKAGSVWSISRKIKKVISFESAFWINFAKALQWVFSCALDTVLEVQLIKISPSCRFVLKLQPVLSVF